MALIAYLAHVGSFVPAQAATVGLLDSILVHLPGAEPLGARGTSSFMADVAQVLRCNNKQHNLCIMHTVLSVAADVCFNKYTHRHTEPRIHVHISI